MNFATSKKSSWPRQAAIVVSDSPNVHMLLRELLRSYSWTVIDSTPSVERAVALLKTGQAFLVITDDTHQIPAVKHLRYLLSDPVAALTPVLSFMLETHKAEAPAMQRLGRPVIVDKPLTPSKFVPGFVSLVRTWEKEPYRSLRQANYFFLSNNEAQGLRSLIKLNEHDLTRPFCTVALSHRLRKLGKVKEAETLLLNSIKRAPRELGCMLALADLYMHAAMPKLAHRLLNGARTNYPDSFAIVPDLVQAALLMGDIDDAIGHLSTMLKAEFMSEETMQFLARLLFAEGREQEAERVLNNNKSALKRIQMGWETAENVQGAATTPAAS